MKTYISSGSIITITAETAIKSGDLVVVGALVGYAQTDAEIGQKVAIVTEGVYSVAVLADADIAVGDVIYLADGALTTAADDGDAEPTPNPRAGIAVTAGVAVEGAASVHVKINA